MVDRKLSEQPSAIHGLVAEIVNPVILHQGAGQDDNLVRYLYRQMEASGSPELITDFLEIAKDLIDMGSRGEEREENVLRVARIIAVFADMPDTISAIARHKAWKSLLDSHGIVGKARFGALSTAIRHTERNNPELGRILRIEVWESLGQKLVHLVKFVTEATGRQVSITDLDPLMAMDLVDLARANDNEEMITLVDDALELSSTIKDLREN